MKTEIRKYFAFYAFVFSLGLAAAACAPGTKPEETTVISEISDSSEVTKPVEEPKEEAEEITEEENRESDSEEIKNITYDDSKVSSFYPYTDHMDETVIDYKKAEESDDSDYEIILDEIEEILKTENYEIRYKEVRGDGQEVPVSPAGKKTERLGAQYTENGADKIVISVDIFEFETLDEADEIFGNYITRYQSEDKLDDSKPSEEYYRTLSNVFIEDETTGSAFICFISQKGKTIAVITSGFQTPPRFSEDAEKPQIIIDTDTTEKILKELDVPYTID